MLTRRHILIGLILAVSILVAQAPAFANLVSSTFNSDLDGWTASGAGISWASSQGNPAGSFYEEDNLTGWAQVIAPAKFHGQWLSTGAVSADIQFAGTGTGLLPIKYPPAFAITDGNTVYYYLFSTNITTSWQTYSVSLSSSGWTKIESDGNNWYKDGAYTQGTHTLAQVLANVTDFRIRTDWSSDSVPPKDAGRLDNIKADFVPLPSTLLLLGSGLVGLGLLRRRWSLKK